MRIVVMIMNDGLERKLPFLLFEVLSQHLQGKETQNNWSLSPDSKKGISYKKQPMSLWSWARGSRISYQGRIKVTEFPRHSPTVGLCPK
jgi:hypothetical protein